MGIPLLQIDAFTNRPFSGNPAAVSILSEPREAEWMQQVAAEMNLSETAFLHQQNSQRLSDDITATTYHYVLPGGAISATKRQPPSCLPHCLLHPTFSILHVHSSCSYIASTEEGSSQSPASIQKFQPFKEL